MSILRVEVFLCAALAWIISSIRRKSVDVQAESLKTICKSEESENLTIKPKREWKFPRFSLAMNKHWIIRIALILIAGAACLSEITISLAIIAILILALIVLIQCAVDAYGPYKLDKLNSDFDKTLKKFTEN
jgi:hypothetical protein